MRVKKEWVPPDWEQIMEKMKEEGRDAASIDNDLKQICHSQDEKVKKTGQSHNKNWFALYVGLEINKFQEWGNFDFLLSCW